MDPAWLIGGAGAALLALVGGAAYAGSTQRSLERSVKPGDQYQLDPAYGNDSVWTVEKIMFNGDIALVTKRPDGDHVVMFVSPTDLDDSSDTAPYGRIGGSSEQVGTFTRGLVNEFAFKRQPGSTRW